MKARLCLGWVDSPVPAPGEGWVGTTLRLFLNHAGNKGPGLGTLEEYLPRNVPGSSWVTHEASLSRPPAPRAPAPPPRRSSFPLGRL